MSDAKDQIEIEKSLQKLILLSQECKKHVREDGTTSVEYTMMTSSSCGIRVCGEEDAEGRMYSMRYFPYCRAHSMNIEECIYINKRVETEAYTGMTDDIRLGISLIFYIQNAIDYLEQFGEEKSLTDMGVKFAAAALKGTIILPTMVRVENSQVLQHDYKKKTELVSEAKKGNQEAIEKLTTSDIDRYAMVAERVKKEDILSIVDTSIVPYGTESDMYNIMGNILSVEKEKNYLTQEEIFTMCVECNDIKFDVYINEKDLIGEPMVGRRFRGSVWIQGELEKI